MTEREFICSKCDGFGYNPNDKTEKICPLCKGSGIVVKKEEKVEEAEPKHGKTVDEWIREQQLKRRK